MDKKNRIIKIYTFEYICCLTYVIFNFDIYLGNEWLQHFNHEKVFLSYITCNKQQWAFKYLKILLMIWTTSYLEDEKLDRKIVHCTSIYGMQV